MATLQDHAVSTASEIAARVAILERKGRITQAELLDEITRLRQKAGKASTPLPRH